MRFWVKAILASEILLFALGTIAAEEVALPSDRRGFFLNLTTQQLDIRGDFNGALTLWHFDKAFFIPRLNRDFLWGLGGGYRRSSGWWEFNALHGNVGAGWNGVRSQASVYVLEVNGAGFLWKNAVVQPYYLLGLCFPWIIVRQGSEFRGAWGDARYTGLGVNAGGGVLVNLGRNVFILGGLKYRYMGFFYVSGGGGKGRDIIDLTVGRGGPAWGSWLRAPSLGLNFSLGIIL